MGEGNTDDFIDISESKDGGVLKKIIKEGTSTLTPPNGSEVEVHYTGTFHGGDDDGEVFDSSKTRNEKFKFKLGEGQVIKAWDQGVASMKKGEVCELICLPEYAYGKSGSGKIGPNRTLKFEVELFGWKGTDISPNKDESIVKSIVTKGNGWEKPTDGCLATLRVVGRHLGREFVAKTVTCEVGDLSSCDLPTGLDVALKSMKRGEVAVFDVKAGQAYGAQGCGVFDIPPHADLELEVTLEQFEAFKSSSSLETAGEKIEYAKELKERATKKFKALNWSLAKILYKQSLSYLEFETDFPAEDGTQSAQERSNLLVSLHSNTALCCAKLGDHRGAIEACNTVTGLEPANEKAHFRRGQARMALGQFVEAVGDFEQLLEKDAGSQAARAQIAVCRGRLREADNKEKSLYKSMMNRMKLPPKLTAEEIAERNEKLSQRAKKSDNANSSGDDSSTSEDAEGVGSENEGPDGPKLTAEEIAEKKEKLSQGAKKSDGLDEVELAV